MESSKLPSDTDPRDYATIDTFESTSEKTKVLTNSVRDLLEVKSTKEVSGTAVVRKFLRCQECSKGDGICDSCKKVFLSDEWRDLHSDWSKRPTLARSERTRGKTIGTIAGTSGKSPSRRKATRIGRESKQVHKLLVEKAALETALLSANNRYDELNDELDGYKRALKFARNFIETEALEHKNRKSDYKVQQQISNLVAMYQNQLKEVSEENARLAAALGRASANTNKLTTASNSYETSLKSDGRQNGNASLIHQGKIASTGAFTWELSR